MADPAESLSSTENNLGSIAADIKRLEQEAQVKEQNFKNIALGYCGLVQFQGKSTGHRQSIFRKHSISGRWLIAKTDLVCCFL